MAAFRPALLRDQRQRRGLTVSLVAKLASTDQSLIWRYEAGERTPSSRTLGRLAGIYQCPVDAFYDADTDDDPVAEYDAHLRSVVAALPPLTAEQRLQLAGLLVRSAS